MPALLGATVLLAVIGALVSRGLRPGPEEGMTACPRSFARTRLAAQLLWENAGGSMAPAPEVRRLRAEELTPLSDPEDADSCRRLLDALPDTLRSGAHAKHLLGLYHAGELYIVAVIPNQTPAEPDAVSRDPSIERPGETHIYGRDFRLLATYSN